MTNNQSISNDLKIPRFKLTASQLPKAEKCPSSILLPKAERFTDRTSADKGITIHKYLELYPKIGLHALDEINSYQSLCAAIPTHKIFDDAEVILTEIGFCYKIDQDDVEVVGQGLSWQDLEPNSINEITGIADCIIEYKASSSNIDNSNSNSNNSSNKKVLVIDYKTGYSEPASSNLQLHFLAYCYAKANKLNSINAAIIYIDDHGQLDFDEITIDYNTNIPSNSIYSNHVTFQSIHNRLLSLNIKLLSMIESNIDNTSVSENQYCEYCQSITYCPIYTGLTKYLHNEGIQGIEKALSGQDRSLGQIYLDLKKLKLIINQVETEIKSLAKLKPIPLPNNKRLSSFTMKKADIDNSRALVIIKKILGDELFLDFFNVKSSFIEKKINFSTLAKLYPNRIAEIKKE